MENLVTGTSTPVLAKLIWQQTSSYTRNSNHITVSILVSICVTTKFCSFTVLNSKDATSLAEALMAMSAKAGVPQTIFTDRESGVVSLGRRAGWRILQTGMSSPQGLNLIFCPSLGSNHVNHATVESRVKAIKVSLGKLDLTKSKLDVISLTHKLDMLASAISITT